MNKLVSGHFQGLLGPPNRGKPYLPMCAAPLQTPTDVARFLATSLQSVLPLEVISYWHIVLLQLFFQMVVLITVYQAQLRNNAEDPTVAVEAPEETPFLSPWRFVSLCTFYRCKGAQLSLAVACLAWSLTLSFSQFFRLKECQLERCTYSRYIYIIYEKSTI